MSGVSIEDRVMIREMYSRYYMAMDIGDLVALRDLLTHDARTIMFDGTVVDAEYIINNAREWSRDPIGRTVQHHITNFYVEPDPDGREDQRRVFTYNVITGVFAPPDVSVRWVSRSQDIVRLVDGKWKLAERRTLLNDAATGVEREDEPAQPWRNLTEKA